MLRHICNDNPLILFWQGPRVADPAQNSHDDRVIRRTRRVRTLDEARALVEQSFGNFVGNDVLTSAQQNLTNLHEEIERLQAENTSAGFFSSLAKELTKKQLQEYVALSKRVAVRFSCILKKML